MTSLRLRPARPARLLQNPRQQPSKRRRATMPRRRSNRGRQLVRPARLVRRRPNRSRRRNLRPPPRSFRRPPQSRRIRTHRRSQRLSQLLPSRLRRSRRTCRRRAPHRRRARRSRRVPRRRRAHCRRRVPRRRCRRGGSSPRAVRSRRGRFCRRPDGRRNVPPKRPRPRGRRRRTDPEPRCRLLACRCRRSLRTVGRSRPRRRHPVRDPASRFHRRQVLPAHLLAAAGRTAQVPPAASDAPRQAAIDRRAAGPVAGALTPGLRHPPAAVLAAPPVALVREGREVLHEAVREADRAGAGAVSAKNCSPSNSRRTPRSMRPSLRARSSSSGDRRPKMSLPG